MASGGEPRETFDYDAIEAAVVETARGRRFLDEFAKRARQAETQTLLQHLKRIENAVSLRPVSGETGDEIEALAAVIAETRAGIASVRNDMIDGGGTLRDDGELFSLIADDAREAAGDVMDLAESSRDEERAQRLRALAWRLDILSQRVGKSMELLAHVDARIAAMAPKAAQRIPALAESLQPAQMKYFAGDEELFEPPAVESAPAPSPIAKAPDRPRIVIIRRPIAEQEDAGIMTGHTVHPKGAA